MNWNERLERWGGAASTRQLRSAGATQRELTAAVASGHMLRPRNGRYASPMAPHPTLLALSKGSRLCCVSAARTYGLWGGTDERIHLVVPPNAGRSGRSDPRTVRHWRRVSDHPEIWRVSFPDCLRTVVRCADDLTAVAVLDTALSSGRVSPYGLDRIFAGEPQPSRRLADQARPGSESGVESILRQLLETRGHRVEQQLQVSGVGRVDMRIDGMLLVEVDGFAFHRDRGAFERDRGRDTALALRGMRWLRVPARQVVNDSAAAVGAVEGMLGLLRREEDLVRAAS
ncbi:hypothetical protein [Leifsonia sp. NPDC077715]|uniref:hypothetical protein n=1 Tax=Leifsonia sp. NPDC077715 TaxID=3155539 RepID=UPI003412BBC3